MLAADVEPFIWVQKAGNMLVDEMVKYCAHLIMHHHEPLQLNSLVFWFIQYLYSAVDYRLETIIRSVLTLKSLIFQYLYRFLLLD